LLIFIIYIDLKRKTKRYQIFAIIFIFLDLAIYITFESIDIGYAVLTFDSSILPFFIVKVK